MHKAKPAQPAQPAEPKLPLKSASANDGADSAEPALAEVKQAGSEKKNRRFGASEDTNYPTNAW